MKILKRALVLLIAIACFAQTPAGFGSLADISGTGSVAALTATRTYAQWIQLQAPSGNSNDVECCDAAVSASRGVHIVAGGVFFLPQSGAPYDLSATYALVQSGDKLRVTYMAAVLP